MTSDYKDLEVWHLARELSIEIHAMTLQSLPKFELFEVGSQIRRSSKSIRANIVEGFGKRDYKHEFIRFLYAAYGSCNETLDHLECLYETHSLVDEQLYGQLHEKAVVLKSKLFSFIRAVQRNHKSLK